MSWVDKLNWYGEHKKPCFFLIDFLVENIEIHSLKTLESQNIFFDFSGKKTQSFELPTIQFSPIPFQEYEKSFQIVKENLENGNSFLTNLTISTPISPVNLWEVYQFSKAKYRVFYKNKWVCFSPETFVKITDNQIFTFPMKGTINADIPNAETLLLQNKKEANEHHTIVDLLRNDLSKVSDNVEVKKFRYVEKIPTQNGNILQTSSEICGNLSENWTKNLGNLLAELLPAGSISGAPKKKTIEIIRQAEVHKRGFYTGIAGYFDGKILDTCVLIRFIENADNQYFYKSGGGITIQSKASDEYQEILQKIYIPQ